MNATDQDVSQESEHSRPDACIHRKHGEALQYVLRACGARYRDPTGRRDDSGLVDMTRIAPAVLQ